MTVDPRAASGFADVAEAYQRGRPGYPREAIDRIVGRFELTASSTVLDLAAGTGQLSRLLQRRVGHVIAVEPVAAMRARIATDLPQITVLDGAAEDIPLAHAAVDAVVVGEAFHWFDVAAASAQIARVLTAQGGVALLWNTPTWTVQDTPWLHAFRQIVADHRRAAGDYPAGNGSWKDPFERAGHFERLVHSQAVHKQTLEPDDLLAQIGSWSWIANLQSAARAAVLDDVAALLAGHGEIVIPYRTDLYLAKRRPAAEPD